MRLIQGREYTERQMWLLRSSAYGIIILPGVFFLTRYWVLLLLSALLLAYAYFRIPIFLEYRSEGPWFRNYVLGILIASLGIGIIPYFVQSFYNVSVGLWLIMMLVSAIIPRFFSKLEKSLRIR